MGKWMGKWIVALLIAVFLLLPLAGSFLVPEDVYAPRLLGLFTPEKEAALARQYLDDLRAGDYAPIKRDFDPAYAPADLDRVLDRAASAFAGEPPKAAKLIAVQTPYMGGNPAYILSYEYEYDKGAVVAGIALLRKDGVLRIAGLHARPTRQKVEDFNAFTFAGKGFKHYLFLALAAGLALFTCVTAFVCLNTPIPRYKWAWVIFVLIGAGSITLNWTTGAFGHNLASLQLFAAGFYKVLYGPVVVKLTSPVGAILFWIQRNEWLDRQAAEQSQGDIRSA